MSVMTSSNPPPASSPKTAPPASASPTFCHDVSKEANTTNLPKLSRTESPDPSLLSFENRYASEVSPHQLQTEFIFFIFVQNVIFNIRLSVFHGFLCLILFAILHLNA